MHELIYDQMRLQEEYVRMIQVDGPWSRVYIKFYSNERMQVILQTLQSQLEYHHDNDELSLVQIEMARMGVRRVRIAKLPPEEPDRTVRDVFSKYGKMKRVTEETWSKVHRYPVSKRIRVMEISLKNTATHAKNGKQSINIVRGATRNLLWVKRTGTPGPILLPQDIDKPPYSETTTNTWANIVAQGYNSETP